METCPKCGKRLIKEDIEDKKAYCRFCIEWFVLKEDVMPEELSNKNLDKNKLLQRKKESYIVYFCLVFIMCISVFFFSVTYYSYVTDGLYHTFTLSDLTQLSDKYISDYKTGLINAVFRLFAYGGMGLLGLFFSSKIGFEGILNDEIKKIKNIILIISVGIIMGLFFTGYDWLFRKDFIPHEGYINLLQFNYFNSPTALFASISEGIGCQILNMLRVSFFLWFFTKIIKSEIKSSTLFIVVAILCALLFAVDHIATTNVIYEDHDYFRKNDALDYRYFRINRGEYIDMVYKFIAIIIITGLYAPLSLVCTFFIKRFGLLGGISIHLICDIIWRVFGVYLYMEERLLWEKGLLINF
jgi:hypothetical protein